MPPGCRNCGEPAPLDYCPACGQRVRDPRRPLIAFLRDFVSEFFSLDGRHLRTALGLLRPGRLTQLYLDGKREAYATPARIYVVASLLFFLLVGLPAPDANRTNVLIDDEPVGREEIDPSLPKFSLSFDNNWLERLVAPNLESKVAEMRRMPPQEVLDRVFAGLERNVPTALIALLPILALVLKMVYWRSRRYYVEHLVFAVHFQSFLFLALVLASYANLLGLSRLIPRLLTYATVFLIVAPLYLVIAARRVYGQSWGWTVVKCGVLALLYLYLMQPVLLVTFARVVEQV